MHILANLDKNAQKSVTCGDIHGNDTHERRSSEHRPNYLTMSVKLCAGVTCKIQKPGKRSQTIDLSVAQRCLQCHRTGILNRGSGGLGQHQLWVHLTRDDHASKAMFQARALRALVQGNIKPGMHRRRHDCSPHAPPLHGSLPPQGANFAWGGPAQNWLTP